MTRPAGLPVKAGQKRGPVAQVIRVRKDGFLYEYNDYLSRNPSCEVITGQQALADLKAQDEQPPDWLEGAGEGEEGEEGGEPKNKRGKKVEDDADEEARRKHALESDATRKMPR